MTPNDDISSGITLPQWFRPRVTERNDFDGANFSPPSHDESFFVIRYPVKTSSDKTAQAVMSTISDVLERKDIECKPHTIDYSKHTEPCKRFLNPADAITISDSVKNPPKSFGIDDGFKGSGAACGSSLIKVAQQMVSSKSLSSRGFKIANIIDENSNLDNDTNNTKTIEDQQHQTIELIKPIDSYDLVDEQSKLRQKLMVRRGSKSLPSSPIGSPKSLRKAQPNPYFTGTFGLTASNSNSMEGRGWLINSLLGTQRATTTSTTSITQIVEESDTNFTTAPSLPTNQTKESKDKNFKVLKAKPSELREMNFWSPTSM